MEMRLALLLLGQQALRTLQLLFMLGKALAQQLGASAWSHARLRFSRVNQFLHTTTGNGIARMMNATQPEALVRLCTHTDACDLVAQAHLVVHPAKGSLRITGAARTHGLAHQVQVIHQWQAAATQRVHRLTDEGLTELINGALNGSDALVITGSQRTADAAVMGEGRLTPGARDDGIMRQRAWTFIQIG